MTRLGDESGQVIVLVTIVMAVLLGFGALVLDVGSWLHAQRQLQTSADAAALAAAQDLPDAGSSGSVAMAQTTAGQFLAANTTANPDTRSGTVTTSFPVPTGTGCTTSNCIAVDATRPTNGLLATVVSSVLGSVTAHAHAQAFLGPPSSAEKVSAAGIPVSQACQPPSCTLPENVTLDFDTTAPLLDLNTHSPTDQTITGSTNSTSIMNQWITTGYDSSNCSPAGCSGELPVNQWYAVDNGQHDGLKQGFIDDERNGTTVIVPVYDQVYPASGPITAYHVVGFAAFVITGVTWSNGKKGKHLNGTLVNYIATGVSAGPGTGQNFGVSVVGIDG